MHSSIRIFPFSFPFISSLFLFSFLFFSRFCHHSSVSCLLCAILSKLFIPPHPLPLPAVIVVDLPSALLSNDTNFSANFISGVILDNEFAWFPPRLSSLYSPPLLSRHSIPGIFIILFLVRL